MKKKLSLTLTVLFLLVTLILLCSCDKVQSDGQDTDSTDTVTTSLENAGETTAENSEFDTETHIFQMDRLLLYFEEPQGEVLGEPARILGTKDDQAIAIYSVLLPHYNCPHTFVYFDNNYIKKIKIFEERAEILGLQVGMTYSEVADIIGERKIVSAFDEGCDFTTESMIDKYSVKIRWELSNDEVKYIGEEGTVIDNVSSYIAENGVGVIQTIEVTLAE